MAASARYTVSGPGIDRRFHDGGPALSAAITHAGRATAESSFYVRSPDGEVYGRVDREDGPRGLVLVHRFHRRKEQGMTDQNTPEEQEGRTILVHLNVAVPADSTATAEQIEKEIAGALEVGTDPDQTPGLFASQTVVAMAEEV